MKYVAIACVLFLLLLFPLSSYSQNTGKINLNVAPKTAIVRIDNTVYDISQNTVISLSEGQHIIEYWAPKMAIERDTVYVIVDSLIQVSHGITILNPRYTQYEEDRTQRTTYIFSSYVQGAAAVGVLGVATGIVLSEDPKIEDNRLRALEAKNRYENIALSETSLQESMEDYIGHKNTYDDLVEKHNRKVVIGITGIAVGTGAAVWYLINRFKNTPEKPKYNETNPFDSSVGFKPIIYNAQGMLHSGISYKF